MYGNRFQYIAIEIEVDMNIRTLSYGDGIPIREKWEEFFSKQVKNRPEYYLELFAVVP